jgi:hypothetical protein
MINGTITRQGIYKTDNEDICEIYICKKDSDKLPHRQGIKSLINLFIGNAMYQSGVHETAEGMVWISSVLYKQGNIKENARLVDALAQIGLKKGDKAKIKSNKDGTFSIVS